MREIKDISNSWASEIAQSYQPDCVVFVAKAGFLIGRELANSFGSPLVGISAARSGNEAKKKLSNLAMLLPERVKDAARIIEIKMKVHNKNTGRQVIWIEGDTSVKNAARILIVDDSIDTGNTIKAVKSVVHKSAPNAIIKIAALNVWREAEGFTATDFYKYTDTILKTPMSNDSREHQAFLREYVREVEKNV